MDTPQIMAAIAARIAEIPGVAGASYPSLNSIPASPWVMVLDGSQAGPSVYQRSMDGQEVRAQVTIRILVKSHKDRPREASKIDSLVAPILDALDPRQYGGVANAVLTDLDGHLDRIWDTATVVRGSTEEYAGEFAYAADIGIDPYFRREPGE